MQNKITPLQISFFEGTPHWRIVRTNEQVMSVKPTRKDWCGFGDSHMFSNGITLGRGDLCNVDAAKETERNFQCYFGLHIVLDANYDLDFLNRGEKIQVRGAQIWRRGGEFGQVLTHWHANSRHKLLSLDFSPELLSRWAEETRLPSWFKLDSQQQIALLTLNQSPRIMQLAAQTLVQPAQTLSDKIMLESLTLSLCSELFALTDKKNNNGHNKIDDAIDVLKTDYAHHLTISELAKRVGTNECYLKRDFKRQTGTTIACFLREHRMQEAMRLLVEERKTLQEVAYFVGYSNVAHFSQIFKNHYGVSAKACLVE